MSKVLSNSRKREASIELIEPESSEPMTPKNPGRKLEQKRTLKINVSQIQGRIPEQKMEDYRLKAVVYKPTRPKDEKIESNRLLNMRRKQVIDGSKPIEKSSRKLPGLFGVDTHAPLRKGIYQILHEPEKVRPPRLIAMEKLSEAQEKERFLLSLKKPKQEENPKSVFQLYPAIAERQPRTEAEKRRKQVERFLGMVLAKREEEEFNAKKFMSGFKYQDIADFKEKRLEKIQKVEKGRALGLVDLDQEIAKMTKNFGIDEQRKRPSSSKLSLPSRSRSNSGSSIK